jgi:ABC-type glutathione transport system ATPase component
MSDVAISVRDVARSLRAGRGMFATGKPIRAVAGVSFDVERGSTFGLVGESGSGKSTTARIVCALEAMDEGTVHVHPFEVGALRRPDIKPFRRLMQMVFQDPMASLNPYWKVGSLIEEGIRVHGLLPKRQRRDRAAELIERCGMPSSALDRHPHEFSGGQQQRISIARALAVDPQILVLDEPVSALDVSIQAQILALLKDLQQQANLTYLFIGHDLAVVERICDRIAVMQQGRIVEEGPTRDVLTSPQDPYTRRLIAATPVPDPTLRRRSDHRRDDQS